MNSRDSSNVLAVLAKSTKVEGVQESYSHV
jgi:hypothetical protein